MASNIPAGLKSADIGRFATRAAQIERVKPVIAYWCNFWIVNQIIERGLHTTDDETKLYTTNLVDKLEQFKSENAENDAVMDNTAAHAYVEQFGLEVFNRAEATMTANKVTKQTADTFQAAATFLELCQVWNSPDAETAARIKFAKYHALRIVKAIKAGEDPNASNPTMQEEWEDLEGLQGPVPQQDVQVFDQGVAQRAAQPSVEDVVDEGGRPSSVPQHSAASPSLPAVPSDIPSAADPNTNAAGQQSPGLNLPSAPDTFAQNSASTPNLPDTPVNLGAPQQGPPPVGPSNPPDVPHDQSSFYNKPNANAFTSPPAQSPSGLPVVTRPQPVPAPAPVPVAVPASGTGPSNPQGADDQAISLAQKHAKWAVSALMFEDVNTAVKELKDSLRHLGAE